MDSFRNIYIYMCNYASIMKTKVIKVIIDCFLNCHTIPKFYIYASNEDIFCPRQFLFYTNNFVLVSIYVGMVRDTPHLKHDRF